MSTTLRSRRGFPEATLVAGLALTIALLVGRAAPAVADGLAATGGPNGGWMMTGTLPRGLSGPAALQAGMGRLNGEFDAAPKLLRAVRSKDGKVTIAVFRAARHGSPLGGLAVATCDSAGRARFAALFDTPKHLPQSLPAMLNRFNSDTKAALEAERPAGGGGPDFAAFERAALRVPLTHTAFPDGTATIGVARGFTPAAMERAFFRASAPDGAYANLNSPLHVLDPSGTLARSEASIGMTRIGGQILLPYNRDPVEAWRQSQTVIAQMQGNPDPDPQILKSKAMRPMAHGFTGRLIAGTMTLHGEPFVFSGFVSVGPLMLPEGGWLLQVSIRGAPAAHADEDMPALIAMSNSERVNEKALMERTTGDIAVINRETSRWLAENQTRNDQIFQQSMSEAAISQDNMNRSTAGFIHHINDQAVVEHDPTGAHGTMDANWADALVKSDPEHFHVVPVSQYVPGRDY